MVDLPRALAEMRRVVKPGGRVVSLEITRPRTPVFRQMFQLYFYRLVPLIGGIIAGDLQAYTYLPNSLTNFPDAQALKWLMLEAGYRHVDVRLLSLGAMALHGVGGMSEPRAPRTFYAARVRQAESSTV